MSATLVRKLAMASLAVLLLSGGFAAARADEEHGPRHRDHERHHPPRHQDHDRWRHHRRPAPQVLVAPAPVYALPAPAVIMPPPSVNIVIPLR